MASSPGNHERPATARKAPLLQELCRLYEQALLAVKEGDLDGAGTKGQRAGRLLEEILRLDRDRPVSTGVTDALVKQAETHSFLRMLRGYRRLPENTGTRIDLTDV